MVRYCTSDVRRVRGSLSTSTQHRRRAEKQRRGVRTSVFPISGSWEAPVIQYSIDEA